jgi:multiple sugar transport system permease protein
MSATGLSSAPIRAGRAEVTPAKTRLRRWSGVWKSLGFAALIAAIMAWCLLPFIWTMLTSLKSDDQMYATPVEYWPNPFNLVHYREIFAMPVFTKSLLNSAIVASASTAISLIIGSVCAYALARLQFPGKHFILTLVLSVAMFPGIVIVGPLFRQFRDWQLTNNYWSLILPCVTFTLPLCIWTLNAFFRDLPVELEESARVDGCTRLQAFVQIILPLSVPGIVTAAILLFIAAWNEFLFARTFMTREDMLTATVVIAQFQGADTASVFPWGQITAGSIVITLPLIIIVLIFQRRLVSGLTAGALKG